MSARIQSHKSATNQELTPWPIVPAHAVSLGEKERRAGVDVANEIANGNTALHAPTAWSGVRQGWRSGPTLYFEDHRTVKLITNQAASNFEYRMLGMAGQGDLYLVSGPKESAFEDYLRDDIGLGHVNVLSISRGDVDARGSLAAACMHDEKALDELVVTAIKNRGLNIVPYQVDTATYNLAQAVAARSGVDVNITGPTPALSDLANDKVWFTRLVEQLLGSNAVPAFRQASSIEEAVSCICVLACGSTELVVKVPNSAGGLGNFRISPMQVAVLGRDGLQSWLSEELASRNWSGGDLLVSVWDADVTASPSVQIWVPCSGEPVIEGIFVQAVKGAGGSFVGAERADLPQPVTQQLISGAFQIATVLQTLGYQGRLSLDTVLIDPPEEEPKLHWIEANARWGGVSIPMTIGHRLNHGHAPCAVQILQSHTTEAVDSLTTTPLTRSQPRTGLLRLLPDSVPVRMAAIYGDSGV